MAKVVERANSEQYVIHDLDIGDLTLSITHLGGMKDTNGHSHPWSEAYYFVSGSGYVEVDGKATVVGAGSFLDIHPDEFHKVLNCTDEPLSFVCAWTNDA